MAKSIQINGNSKIKTGIVHSEGDNLYYQICGEGVPLLMIPGAGGDAGFYQHVAEMLSAAYTVITYDRRANSRSSRNHPLYFEINQQSRDIVAIIEDLKFSSAIIFGSSGGAVIALDFIKSFPSYVIAAVIHEPPVISILPDYIEWRLWYAKLYKLSCSCGKYGAILAMLKFAYSLHVPWNSFKLQPEDMTKRIKKYGNQGFLLHQEMMALSGYSPDLEVIKSNDLKIGFAVGEMTQNKELYYGRTVPILSDKLNAKMTVFPGHHLSYIDTPGVWQEALQNLIQSLILND